VLLRFRIWRWEDPRDQVVYVAVKTGRSQKRLAGSYASDRADEPIAFGHGPNQYAKRGERSLGFLWYVTPVFVSKRHFMRDSIPGVAGIIQNSKYRAFDR
jgi:hypothetical protein